MVCYSNKCVRAYSPEHLRDIATCYDVVRRTTTYYDVLRRTTMYYDELRHTTTYYDALRRTTANYVEVLRCTRYVDSISGWVATTVLAQLFVVLIIDRTMQLYTLESRRESDFSGV